MSSLVLNVEIIAGDTSDQYMPELIELADSLGVNVSTVVNDCPLTATPGMYLYQLEEQLDLEIARRDARLKREEVAANE